LAGPDDVLRAATVVALDRDAPSAGGMALFSLENEIFTES
jgi:hypothetical protein